jgi:hypothetical protein
VQFILILAHPKPTNEEYGRVDGAWVSCWVNEPVPAAAEAVAIEFLDAMGWDVDEVDETHPIDEKTYGVDDLGRGYVEQARIDGIVIRMHTWDVGAPDE